MPCRDYQADEEVRHEAGERLDAHARRLCEAMAIIEDMGMLKRTSRELRAWWTAHKIADEKEMQRRMKLLRDIKDKNRLIAKLTARERKLLGV